MTKFIVAFLSLWFINSSLFAQKRVDSLDTKLSAIQTQSKLPGFAVAIVNENKILYQKGFGYADLETKTPFTEQTILNIGSVSKTFIAAALMKLVEEGKLNLDAKINDILPFPIVNPRFPNTPITVRHLATHTSGIVDTKFYNRECYVLTDNFPENLDVFSKSDQKSLKQLKGNTMTSIDNFLKDYLTPTGSLYSKKNFNKSPSGTKYEYSNIGSTVAALIVEIVSQQNYGEYVKEHVLTPLKMVHSGWKFDDIDMEKHATLYLENNVPMPQYTLITYPDGGLLSNCHDLSLYLQAMIQGNAQNSDFLKASTFEEMMRMQYQDEDNRSGIFWDISKRGHRQHNGGDPGIFTWIRFDPATNIGLIFMTNVLAPENEEMLKDFKQIMKNLSKHSKKF